MLSFPAQICQIRFVWFYVLLVEVMFLLWFFLFFNFFYLFQVNAVNVPWSLTPYEYCNSAVCYLYAVASFFCS